MDITEALKQQASKWTHAQALDAVKTTEYAEHYTNGYDKGCEREQHIELVSMLVDLGFKPPAKKAHASVAKAPALVTRLIKELEDLGYEYDEAVAMLDDEGTRSIREFIEAEKAEAAGYTRKPELDTPASTCYVKTDSKGQTTNVKQITKETKDMALVITTDNKGNTTEVKHVDFGSGAGVQAAKPLPKVEPTKVEPTAEQVYDYNLLPAELQRLVDDVSLHRMPVSVGLPVVDIVGWNSDTMRPIYKVRSGQAALHAYGWLYLTDAKGWQNLPMIVVAPTDIQLLKVIHGFFGHDVKPAEATFKLVGCESLMHLTTLDYSQFAKVVAAPASTPKQAAKVKRAAAKPEQAPTPEPEKKAPAITDAVLQELASAANHMKKVSLVNQILVALGEPKVSSKCKKDELTPVISRLLAQFNIPVAEPASTTTKSKATAAASQTKVSKAELEKWYVSSGKGTKKEFAALEYNWRSSNERTRAAKDLGFTYTA